MIGFSLQKTKITVDIHVCTSKTSQGGAWWYGNCANSNLNGLYNQSAKNDVNWYHWKNRFKSLKEAEMKIRPRQ